MRFPSFFYFLKMFVFKIWQVNITMHFPSSDDQQQRMSVNLDIYDAIQVQLLEELCILVDENDKVLGSDSKKNC